MRTIVRYTLVLVAIAILAVACSSPSTPPKFEPADVEITKYPILAEKRQMVDAEIAKFGLRRVKLDKSLQAFIHFRFGADQSSDLDRESHWHWRLLRVGTMVAVDASGRPWYRVNTSTRLFVPAASYLGNFRGFWPSWLSPSGWSWPDLPWWWPFLLVIPGLGLVGYGLYRLLRRPIRRSYYQNYERALREPMRPVEPTTVAPPAPAPQPMKPAAASSEDCCQELKTRLGVVERDVSGIKQDVGEIKTAVTGMEERVVVRLEPVVKAAAEDGGRKQAQAAIAAQIAAASAAGNAPRAASLKKVLETLGGGEAVSASGKKRGAAAKKTPPHAPVATVDQREAAIAKSREDLKKAIANGDEKAEKRAFTRLKALGVPVE